MLNSITEIWKPIIDYEGLYEISNLMNIKSFNYRMQIDPRKIKRIMNMIENKIKGYKIAQIFNIGQGTISKIKRNLKSYKNRWTLLKPGIDDNGYLYVHLYKDKTAKMFRIHELMLKTFIGPCPEGMECRHLDGNPKNNKLNNLKWGTRSENVQDSIKHGTRYQPNNNGAKNGLAKLNNNKIREIRKLHSEGVSQKELSIRFNVGTSCICSIINYKTWKCI